MKPSDLSNAQDATELLAAGLAEHVAAWVAQAFERDGAQPEPRLLQTVRRAAFHASLATSNGHACALLDEIFGEESNAELTDARQLLLRSGVVGSPEQPGAMPLILDSANRLYLHRYFDYERRLARRLLLKPAPAPIGAEARAQLQQLFAANRTVLGERPDWQQIAAALALRQPLTVISGGPGTGKTTTVVNILACLLTQAPGCRIALAAPTGKAAARMLEAIRARAEHLPPALRELLPQQSYTVHRLLGATPTAGVFRHDAGNPLALDVLVVDEASMLDLALAVKLFEAVPPGARIVLLGDKDQLAAVESGAVFAELCADPTLSAGCIAELAAASDTPAERIRPPAPLKSTALHDSVVWFAENFRFRRDSGIGRLAAGIGAGDPAGTIDWLRAQDGSEVRWSDDGDTELAPETVDAMLAGYAGYAAAVHGATATSASPDIGVIFDAFGRFRVLCALRNGARGVEQVNALLSARLRLPLGAAAGATWYAGRPVIILRNDYSLRLFNGDIGITLCDAGGELLVYFPDAEGGARGIAPGRLPPHETAFAMTVHKSQGSEFERVLLLLPEKPNRVITRELLYTGVTRARHQVHLVGPGAVIEYAICTPTRRHSGLLDRLGEIAAET